MKTFFFESIYNTQEYALSELSSEPILVISYSQEKGKGTSNRTWLNADQALACSLAVKQEDIEVKHTLIPLIAGYVFTEVLNDISLRLKWPNDIVLNNLKVGGILVEKSENNICIGMGINYFWEKHGDIYFWGRTWRYIIFGHRWRKHGDKSFLVTFGKTSR